MSDLAAIRARLAAADGRTFWRSLDELVETPEFVEFMEYEFPRQAEGLLAALDRRAFVKLMGASFALAGLGACTKQPEERIVPYVRQPERLVLGEPLYYATAMPLYGFGIGVLAESHEGRPTKIEGNPEHPASLGATDAPTQASVLGLYDPDRSQTVVAAGEIRTWDGFLAAMRPALAAQATKRGAGLRILTDTVTSPTLARQLRELLDAFPEAQWVQYDADGRDNVRAGAEAAFGEIVEPQYRLADAQVVLALDADLFGRGPARLRLARDLARARRLDDPKTEPLRLYAVEATPTTTGAVADHRIPLAASRIGAFADRVADRVRAGIPGRRDSGTDPAVVRIAEDLVGHHGRSLVVAGDDQPAAVHAIAHAMNASLGNVGHTVVYTTPVEAAPRLQLPALRQLADDMRSGRVDLLLVLGGNPVVTAPADLDFAGALERVALRVHLGLYEDETALYCHWHVPEAHYLESWGDVRAFDGTATLIQPLIAPLYGGQTATEVLAALLESPERRAYDVLRATWRASRHDGGDFETFWQQALHDGVVAGTVVAPKTVARPRDRDPVPAPASGLEVVLRPDPYLADGRFANNGWLQELPRPLTKLVWDNAALVAPATAEGLDLANGDVVEIAHDERSVRVPVWIVPGHAPESFTLHLGSGRTRAGRVATGVGFDVSALRTIAAPSIVTGVRVTKTGDTHPLASTQDHQTMEGRPIVRTATLEHWREHPDFAQHMEHVPARDETLYPNVEYRGYAWGMAIDVGACIGCNACVAACVAENNISVVGKSEVMRGREMHWLRVDRYYVGDLDAPETVHQPLPCMHCENAPCEVVCPVNATVHSSEGLNDMVYNRCVGTRYCSNNCPYKVRRFNYFLYANWIDETIKMARNPDVSVRSRGVMEKCTYCVQRIEYVRGKAESEGRAIRDGEVVSACQQACPTEAIVFGNVNDPESRVAKMKKDPRNYALLGELNTRPRTTYLAQVRNPNAAMEKPRGMSTPEKRALRDVPLVEPGYDFASITDKISAVVLTKGTPRFWWIGFGIGFLLLNLMLMTVAHLVFTGIGIWGPNVPVGWGMDIINFVWWIGIGHAGTLISAILLLLRQEWRNSINRFAEAMTIFAVAAAGMYPLLHTGRPWLDYWLLPYPNTMGIWPNFRSPLIWDVFAVSTYATVSLLFWFVGMLPDLATLRDRSPSRVGRFVYGMLAMGWRGSARHWSKYETATLLLAALSTPLVVSVHTIVSLDFAVGIIPGWHATIFPPYFVAGAIFAGFAMVLTLAIPLRRVYGLQDLITARHLNYMGRIILATGLVVAYGYMMETFMAWYSGNTYEAFMMWNRFTGPYAPVYWSLILCNVLVPQLLWFERVRLNELALLIVCMFVNVGMFLERYVIIVVSLHRDFLPSSWGMYSGTFWDWSMFLGTMGLFLTLFFLFIRFLPMISIFEMRVLLPGAEVKEEGHGS